MKCRYYSVQGTSFFLFFHTLELYSVRCKKCKHTRQEKITIFRGKEKTRYFYIHRRPILYQTENHDH
jgi:ribosomal protein L21